VTESRELLPERGRVKPAVSGAGVLAYLLYLPVSFLTTGLMGKWAWNMVVPEVFDGPCIGIVDAIGVALLVDFFAYHHHQDDRSVGEVIGGALAVKVMFLLFFLLYGWLR
jgi:hypothetical protein